MDQVATDGSLHLHHDLFAGRAAVRRCTWAIDAAASGLAVEAREDGLERAAEVRLDDLPDVAERLGRHLVAALLELVDELVGEEALARRR